MGSVQGKNKTNSVDTPVSKEIPTRVSPLYAIAASLNGGFPVDPRSPGSKRTPVSTPFESPCSTPTFSRIKQISRLGSSSKFGQLDPRSPASKRTPIGKSEPTDGAKAIPPFSLGDPRSPLPFQMRTPLTDSVKDAIVVPDDMAISPDRIEEQGEVVSENIKKEEEKETEQSSAASESTSDRVITEIFDSPGYSPSPTVMALVSSPLSSPIGSRKRKENLSKGPHSPLKKSYSAPIDENAPPSPINKPIKNRARVRTPLSPLSQRTIKSNFMAVQPIKLRMDPAILG